MIFSMARCISEFCDILCRVCCSDCLRRVGPPKEGVSISSMALHALENARVSAIQPTISFLKSPYSIFEGITVRSLRHSLADLRPCIFPFSRMSSNEEAGCKRQPFHTVIPIKGRAESCNVIPFGAVYLQQGVFTFPYDRTVSGQN